MTFIPFVFDGDGRIELDEAQLELAFARSTILAQICKENGIRPDEAMLALAVFLGRELRDCSQRDARRTVDGLVNLMWRVATSRQTPVQ